MTGTYWFPEWPLGTQPTQSLHLPARVIAIGPVLRSGVRTGHGEVLGKISETTGKLVNYDMMICNLVTKLSRQASSARIVLRTVTTTAIVSSASSSTATVVL